MAVRPKRPCTKPGCGKLVDKGRCDEHQVEAEGRRKASAQRYNKERGSAASRGYDARWTAYSKDYRSRNPLCVDCLTVGVLTSVEHGGHVDHIKAVAGPDDPLFWSEDNHQSLCNSHHSAKTAREDQGFGNPRRRG